MIPSEKVGMTNKEFLNTCIFELTASKQSRVSAELQENQHFRECFEDVLMWIKRAPERAEELSSLLECETGVLVHPLRLRLFVEDNPE